MKKEWDADTINGTNVRAVLSGTPVAMLRKDLTESLFGRFEETWMAQWRYPEMRSAFGTSISEYLRFGGYPLSAQCRGDEKRWREMILNLVVEPALLDVLSDGGVAKPELLRRTFGAACVHSGEVLSYTKLIRELGDAGNTTTVAHYMERLGEAGLVSALPRFSSRPIRERRSIPKYQVWDNGLWNAVADFSFDRAKADSLSSAQILESAVGAHNLGDAFRYRFSVSYWKDRGLGVAFVIECSGELAAINVEGGTGNPEGLSAFRKRFPLKASLTVVGRGMPDEEFLSLGLRTLFS